MTFTTTLPVSIEHVNYGGHLGHDRLISMMHEARLQFFDSLGQSEIDFFGISLILKSLMVDYRSEGFRGDALSFAICVDEVRGSGFSLNYYITNQRDEVVAEAKLVQVGFDYQARRVARLPSAGREALLAPTIEQC